MFERTKPQILTTIYIDNDDNNNHNTLKHCYICNIILTIIIVVVIVSSSSSIIIFSSTLQLLYNTVRYNTVLDITRFKDGPQNVYIILKNDHKWSFFNIIYTFLFGYNMVV